MQCEHDRIQLERSRKINYDQYVMHFECTRCGATIKADVELKEDDWSDDAVQQIING